MEQQKRVADTLRRMAEKTDSYDLFTRAQELGFQWGIINSPRTFSTIHTSRRAAFR